MTTDDDGLPSSRGRTTRLGGLGLRLGGSYLGNRIAAAFKSGDAKKDALRRMHERNAERVVETLGALKGAAMKIGQTVALMGRELPPEATAILRRLYDAAPPVPFEVVREELEGSLGGRIEDLFLELDPVPIGAASLAQAHAAKLPDGRPVVVKVLYRGIERSVDADLGTLKKAISSARLLARSKEEIDGIFEEVRARLHEELDYRHEAANIEAFQVLREHVPDIEVPRVHASHSSPRVLTMDRLEGMNFEQFMESAPADAKRRAGETLVNACLAMMFRMRALHADPHGGNFLFSPEGKIGLIDYGCVRFFPIETVTTFARFVKGVLGEDRELVMSASRDIGMLATDKKGAEDLLWEVFLPLSKLLNEKEYTAGTREAELVEEWKKLGSRFLRYPGVRYPSEVVYLDRSFGGIYGMLRRMRHAAPYGRLLLESAEHALAVAEGRSTDEGIARVRSAHDLGRVESAQEAAAPAAQ